MKKILRYLLAFVFVFNLGFSSTNLVFAENTNWIHIHVTGDTSDIDTVEVVWNGEKILCTGDNALYTTPDAREYAFATLSSILINGLPVDYNPGNEANGTLNVKVKYTSPITQKYTVTYEPGDYGTFATQVYPDLASDTPTPAFDGEKTHQEGYTFASWDKVIADTVTESVTYTALWTQDPPPTEKYTVTYAPGDHGTFTSQVNSDLTSGTATPAFAGDTTHETGYTFAGWDKTIAATVTESVTYTALWTQDPPPTEKYTVTYAPGEHGTFASQVYPDLASGAPTPAFDGEKTHQEGYTFAGWDKDIANKVTESVTYTALWTQDPPPAEKGSISGIVFNDLNKNGAKDIGEPGLAGWKVDLTGTATASATTDTNGNYSFTDLLDGSYNVNEEVKNGWIKTLGGYLGITIGEIKNILNQDFGNYKEPEQNTDNPDISITKTANVSSAHRGDTITYTITVTNTGNVALENVKVTDPMITGFGEETVNLGVDTGTKSKTYTVGYTVPTDQSYGELTNTAYATEAQYGLSVQDSADVNIIRHSSGGGTTTIDEDEETPLGPAVIPGLKVTKDVDKAVVKVGDTLKYTITVKNTGNVELTNVSVTDSMIGLSENIAKLAADETKTFVKDYVVPAGTAAGALKNTATASAVYNSDPVTASGSAVTNVKADEQPMVNIPEEETPKGGLPKTGGMPLTDLFAIGSGLAALGFLLRRKQ